MEQQGVGAPAGAHNPPARRFFLAGKLWCAVYLALPGFAAGLKTAATLSSTAPLNLGQLRFELLSLAARIDWDEATQLLPWLSPIHEGSPQGLAIVLGQSLKPDGATPQVLRDRAALAAQLLDEGRVAKVMVSGADTSHVGETEAFAGAVALKEAGVPSGSIIQETQAITTAENAWFMLRWMPQGTGQLHIVTSDFHMARATYIFNETLNFFYRMVEDRYRQDPRWSSTTRRYPRLTIHQAPSRSFCGSDASLNSDGDPTADINSKSLAFRALSELTFLGSREVDDGFYGAPQSKILYIWPVPINVTQDPENEANFQAAMAQAERAAEAFCVCKAPPQVGGPAEPYPLQLPIPSTFPQNITASDWQQVIDACPGTADAVQ